VTTRKRGKLLLDDFKEAKGYCKLKEELSVEKTLWKTIWTNRNTDYEIMINRLAGWSELREGKYHSHNVT
jgi:hypothetical protein